MHERNAPSTQKIRNFNKGRNHNRMIKIVMKQAGVMYNNKVIEINIM